MNCPKHIQSQEHHQTVPCIDKAWHFKNVSELCSLSILNINIRVGSFESNHERRTKGTEKEKPLLRLRAILLKGVVRANVTCQTALSSAKVLNKPAKRMQFKSTVLFQKGSYVAYAASLLNLKSFVDSKIEEV